MSEKSWVMLAITFVLVLCVCSQQGVESQSANEASAMSQIEEMRQPMGEEETGTPEMQPLEPAPEEQTPEKTGVPQKVPGFEAYLTLGVIGLAAAPATRKRE
jgi:hypothetical protein